ncbi:ABC transporter ATP-binding protein [Kitasatospora sp. NBC_01266]|uniref:ABC transporter ATP-binding protein n=1 Tax=Kitasatospora sp. NBC_01266 TaxID=2903572 RepID=UPI002E35383F|nr:ABC transporter ATP-binding protein [Kitasatospora sp. NBC_01266]
MTTDELDPLPGAWRSLGRSLRMGWRSSPAMIAAAFCAEALSAVPDAMFAWGLAAFATAVITGSGAGLAASSGLLAAMAAGNWLLQTVSTRVNQRFADRAAVVVESHIAELLAGVSTIEHHERPAQLDRISVLRDHASALSDLYRHLFSLVGVLLRAAITLGLLASVNPLLMLLGLFPLPTVLVSGRRAAVEKRVEEAGARHDRLARHLFLLATSAVAGKELRVARTGPLVRRLRHRAWEQRHRPLARARWISAAWQSGAQALFGAAFIAAVAYTAAHSADRTGAVLLVLAAGSRLSGYIGQTITQIHFFRTIWLDCSRKLAWLEDYAAKRLVAADRSAPERLSEGIRLDAVSFAYPGTDRLILDEVSVLLPAGAVVAVVGENGAGKSSLVKLLCGLYTPTSGRITLDGQDLARTDPVSWRRRVTGTFQDFFAFEFRLRLSVGIGDLPRADQPDAVDTALEKAAASDIARALPEGVHTQLGVSWPQGVDLSHGQWQRVALARGFMRDQPLLTVLDEPTSAVDAETEHALFDRYTMAARTGAGSGTGGVTLLVSHRFSTVRAADLILVLNGARATEFGTHDQLIALGGHYAQLYGIQAEAYRTGLR